jgi:hypothetical protein
MSTPGGPIGLTYRVSAAQALAGHGVWLTLTGQSGRRFWEGRVDAIGVLPKHVRPRLPLTATWSGFFLAKAEEISFTTAGADAVQLSVQGAAALPGRPIKLDQGWVAFAARARLTQLARVRLLLTSAAGHTSELDRGSLWPRRAVGGLAVTLEGPANITHRIDPFVAASILGARGTHASNALFLKRDPDFVPIASREQDVVRVRWLGELYATGGTYRMELRTDAHARLYIGSHLVLDLCDNEAPRNSFYNPGGYVVVPGGYPVRTALVTLPRGWHRVRLYLEATGINSGLEWAWTRPDGVREIVPPRVLRHNDRQGAEGSRTSSIRC